MDATTVCMPRHGKIECNQCFHGQPVVFNGTRRVEGNWRITHDPMAWGSQQPEIVVLGFSKGPTQTKMLKDGNFNDIPYARGRLQAAKILAHVGLLEPGSNEELKRQLAALISDETGPFHFGSLVRCRAERYDKKAEKWTSVGGGMLDRFIATPFGHEVVTNCMTKHLQKLPDTVKLVVLFGMGSKGSYIEQVFKALQSARPGSWERLNKVSYRDEKVTFVHVEHFRSQGALIPMWLGDEKYGDNDRSVLADQAKNVVKSASTMLHIKVES